jgi:hypothetical protein
MTKTTSLFLAALVGLLASAIGYLLSSVNWNRAVVIEAGPNSAGGCSGTSIATTATARSGTELSACRRSTGRPPRRPAHAVGGLRGRGELEPEQSAAGLGSGGASGDRGGPFCNGGRGIPA